MKSKKAIYEAMKKSILIADATLESKKRKELYTVAQTGLVKNKKDRLENWAVKVSKESFKTTVEDVEALTTEGFSDAEIFEASVVAAFSAADLRLRKGLSVLEKVK